jgi:hypothetical protein
VCGVEVLAAVAERRTTEPSLPVRGGWMPVGSLQCPQESSLRMQGEVGGLDAARGAG